MRRNSRLWTVIVVLALIAVAGMCGGKTAFARSFPEWKDEPIQVISDNPIFASDKIAELNRKLADYPHPVKVLILESLDEKAGSYAREAFAYYGLPDDQLLVVFVLESGEMEAVAGPRLMESGITPEELADKKALYFDNFKKTGNYLEGLDVFIEEVFREIKEAESAHQEEGTGVDPAVQTGSTDGQGSPSSGTAAGQSGWTAWLVRIMAFLAILLAGGALFFWWQRRRMLLELDQLEEWKEELEQRLNADAFPPQHRAVQEGERIRQENLRRIAEDYRARVLPSLEEDFAEAELLVTRFRIFSARAALRFIEQTLEEMETVLEQFDSELSHASEIRSQAAGALERADKGLARMRKKILEIRSQYGVGFQRLSQFLNETEKELLSLRNAVKEGKELDASLLQELLNRMDQIEGQLDQADEWAAKMEEQIPSRLKELENRWKKARDAGKEKRGAEVLQIVKECREKWNSLLPLWDEGNLPELIVRLNEIEARLREGEAMLQTAESLLKELEEMAAEYEKRLRDCTTVYAEDKEKLKRLVHRYQLEGDPVLDLQQYIERELSELDLSYQGIAEPAERGEYKEACAKARELLQRISALEGRISDYHQRVLLLSSGEEQYIQEIRSLRNRLRLLRQKLDRFRHLGNVDHLLDLIEQSRNAILVTEVLFDQIPLHLNKILHHLQQAREQVDKTEEMINRTIESAQEAEAIICRLNIYRNRIPQIGQLLMMAENYYWDNRYEEALDTARKAEQLLMKKRA